MGVAFRLPGEIPVYTFALLLGLGAMLGMLWPARRLLRHPDIIRLGLLSMGGALLGGRLAYVAVNWAFYQANPGQIIQLPLGGLSWPGAFAAGLLTLALLSRTSPVRWPVLLDTFFPALAIITTAAWLGCWSDGCAYGAPATAWYALPAYDEWGNLTARIPLQFIGSLAAMLTLWSTEFLRGTHIHPHRTAHLGTFLLAAQLWGLSYLKADPAPLLSRVRLESWAALALTVLFAGLTLHAFRTPPSPRATPRI